MSAPHIILDNLPSLCQQLSDLVEVWRSYNENDFACFFLLRHGVFWYLFCVDIFRPCDKSAELAIRRLGVRISSTFAVYQRICDVWNEHTLGSLGELLGIFIFVLCWGYRGGSPTAVQAWQTCPLWEPSPIVTPYYCRLGDMLCYIFVSF